MAAQGQLVLKGQRVLLVVLGLQVLQEYQVLQVVLERQELLVSLVSLVRRGLKDH